MLLLIVTLRVSLAMVHVREYSGLNWSVKGPALEGGDLTSPRKCDEDSMMGSLDTPARKKEAIRVFRNFILSFERNDAISSNGGIIIDFAAVSMLYIIHPTYCKAVQNRVHGVQVT